MHLKFQCIEKCTWRCAHLQCTMLCSEPCDRELCEHPSAELLRCGHRSIGVCGEKVPNLCRICDEDSEVFSTFFGDEDENDARFIELEDCKHSIEVNGLLRWMKSEPESNSELNQNSQNSIQLKKCPKCTTIIRHTKSLNAFNQASLRDIQKVKIKTCGSPEANCRTQEILFGKVDAILQNKSLGNDPFNLRSIYQDIHREVKFTEIKSNPKKSNSNQMLTELNNKFALIERLRKMCTAFCQREKSKPNVSVQTIEQFDLRLRMAIAFVCQYKNCEQQRSDISKEISFLQLMSDMIVQVSGKPFSEEGLKLLENAFKVANKYGSVNGSIQKEFKEIVTEAYEKSSTIRISLEEKEIILEAMGLSRGHWYKCPNGHVYAVGDCGGAMERSNCPECGSVIGGEQHRLVDGNVVATEMDGATFPAWPQ